MGKVRKGRTIRRKAKTMRRKVKTMRRAAKSVKNRKVSRKKKSTKKSTKKKGKRPLSSWNKQVAVVYKSLKKTNPNATLGDAMKKASKDNKNKRPLSLSVD